MTLFASKGYIYTIKNNHASGKYLRYEENCSVLAQLAKGFWGSRFLKNIQKKLAMGHCLHIEQQSFRTKKSSERGEK